MGSQDHAKGFLYDPVPYTECLWPFLPVGLWDVHPSNRDRFKGLGFEHYPESFKVTVQVSIEVTHGLPVDSCGFSSDWH